MRKKEVLIVENNHYIQLLLEAVFDSFNITHTTASTINLAKQKLENSIPQLIILGNCLSDGKGLDFIEFLYENFPCTRIILYTEEYVDINKRKLKEKIHLYAPRPSIYPIFKMIENRQNWHSCDKLSRCFPQTCPKFE